MTESGRGVARGPLRDIRPLAVRVIAAPDLDATEDVEACRVRDAGAAGGPIDVRAPELGRVFEPADGTRALEGVPVRETVALGGPLSCFVGDFVGDYPGVSIH